MRPLFIAPIVIALAITQAPRAGAQAVDWSGRGRYRVLLEVDPVATDGRPSDELVALFALDLQALGPVVPRDRSIDFESLEVIRYRPETGRAEKYANNAFGVGDSDRPFQFYDSAYPEPLADYTGYLSLDHLRGVPLFRSRVQSLPSGARHFNVVGRGRQGKLAWLHTQQGELPSRYAVSFNLLPAGQEPESLPAGFVGDGSSRFVKESRSMGPPGNVKGRAVDWDGDGLPDILFGSASGHLTLYRNSGKPGQPRFGAKRLLADSDGVPIDVGYDSCPWVTDWNGDGRKDLLVGAAKGCVAYYENVGDDRQPRLKFAGLLESAGALIVTPAKPIAEPHGEEVFRHDYFPIPCVADWDGDGDGDLLLGGYVTGLVFFYENINRDPEGRPVLVARGPLEADGRPIDTGWHAAPAVADLDGDGDLDLICGGQPVSLQGSGSDGGNNPSPNLSYYENVGTRTVPRLTKRGFPADGTSPFRAMTVPTIVDWDGDGRLDLVVICHTRLVYFVRNVGTPTAPRFDWNVPPVGASWQLDPLPAGQLLDVDGDGNPDLAAQFSIFLNSGKPLPGFLDLRIDLRGGKSITHPVPHGDENSGIVLHDFDRDGDLDGLYGAHGGYIWFHENRGSNAQPDLDAEGKKLRLVSGAFVKVGLPEGARGDAFDFNVLQGARPRPVPGDFNRDGRNDLVVGDTYGKVRYYENRGTNAEPAFAEPVLVDDRGSRVFVAALDFNGDGWLDLVVLKGKPFLLLNKGSKDVCEFLPPRLLELPEGVGYIYSLAAADWNHDGDEDILYNTAQGCFCFVERSFLRHGYRPARLLAVEERR